MYEENHYPAFHMPHPGSAGAAVNHAGANFPLQRRQRLAALLPGHHHARLALLSGARLCDLSVSRRLPEVFQT